MRIQIVTNPDKRWENNSTWTDKDAEMPNVSSVLKSVDKKDANLVAEQGELVTSPDLSTIHKVGGKRHSQGGTPLKLEPESFIFSRDRSLAFSKKQQELFGFKLGGKTKEDNTPAKVLARQVDLKHHNQMNAILGDERNRDITAKNTAKVMLQKNQEKMGQVAFLQEAKKQFKQGIPAFAEGTQPIFSKNTKDDMDTSKQFMQLGGALPKAQIGGINQRQIFDSKGNPKNGPDDTGEGYYVNGYWKNNAAKKNTFSNTTSNFLKLDSKNRLNWKNGPIPKTTMGYGNNEYTENSLSNGWMIAEDDKTFTIKVSDGNEWTYNKKDDPDISQEEIDRIYSTVKRSANMPTDSKYKWQVGNFSTSNKSNPSTPPVVTGNSMRPLGTQNNTVQSFTDRKPVLGVGLGNGTPSQATNRTSTPQSKITTPQSAAKPNVGSFINDRQKEKYKFDMNGKLVPANPATIKPFIYTPPTPVTQTTLAPKEFNNPGGVYTNQKVGFNTGQIIDMVGSAAINSMRKDIYPMRSQDSFNPLEMEKLNPNQALQDNATNWLQASRIAATTGNNSSSFAIKAAQEGISGANKIGNEYDSRNVQIGNQQNQYNNQGYNAVNARNVQNNSKYVDQVNLTLGRANEEKINNMTGLLNKGLGYYGQNMQMQNALNTMQQYPMLNPDGSPVLDELGRQKYNTPYSYKDGQFSFNNVNGFNMVGNSKQGVFDDELSSVDENIKSAAAAGDWKAVAALRASRTRLLTSKQTPFPTLKYGGYIKRK